MSMRREKQGGGWCEHSPPGGKEASYRGQSPPLSTPAWQSLPNNLSPLPTPASSAQSQGVSLGLVTAAPKEVLGG